MENFARRVTLNVTAQSVLPDGVIWGGMQYEDNATLVEFLLDEEFAQKLQALGELRFRIDFNSLLGGYDPSENLELGFLCRAIPQKFTCFGGVMQVTLVATATREGKSYTVLTVPVEISFTSVERDRGCEREITQSLSQLEQSIDKRIEGCLSDTDIATADKAGAVRVGAGLIAQNGALSVKMASDAEILQRTDKHNPIVSGNLERAVKSILTDCPWSNAEAEAARAKIGASSGSGVLVDSFSTSFNDGSNYVIALGKTLTLGKAYQLDYFSAGWGHYTAEATATVQSVYGLNNMLALRYELPHPADPESLTMVKYVYCNDNVLWLIDSEHDSGSQLLLSLREVS